MHICKTIFIAKSSKSLNNGAAKCAVITINEAFK